MDLPEFGPQTGLAVKSRRWNGRHYLLAVFVTAIVLSVRLLLDGFHVGSGAPFFLFSLAILISAWIGGFGPGLLSSFLCYLSIQFFFVEPRYSFAIYQHGDIPLLLMFLVEGVLISYLGQARIKAIAALQRSHEERLRQLVESVRDYAIIMLDPAGRVVSWNLGAERTKGYKESEILGKHFSCFYPAEDVARGKPEYELRVAAETGRFEDEGWRVRKDGSQFWANVIVTPIRDPAGHLVGYSKITRDISERRRAEEALCSMNEKLQISNRELQDFASVASHDLQEPLRKIQAFGDRLMVKCAPQLGPEGQDYLQRMQNAAGRMRVLIEDLLTFSRVTTRAQPFQKVDLRQVAREVLSDMEATVARTQARVNVGDLPEVDADPTQMRQLLQNLISNAVKFSRPEATPVVDVTADLDGRDGRRVRLTVKDNGIGFDEKYLDRIFNVFQRLHGRNSYEGTGIGLAVCRKIVERHHGSITARSQLGEGSAFIIDLPLHQSDGGIS